MELKRILILTADTGFGHRSAAKAVRAALEEKYGDRCRVDIVNPLDDKRAPFFLRDSQSDYDRIVREVPQLYQLGYQASDNPLPVAIFESALTLGMFEVLRELLKQYRPDAILNTYPMYQAPLRAVFSLENHSIPMFTVITDLVSVHKIWFHPQVDGLFVPTEEVRQLALDLGIAPEKVMLTGIPVHPAISREKRHPGQIRASLGWETDLPTFLAIGSKRVEGLEGILNVFNHFGKPLQLAVVAGKDHNLYESLLKMEWHVPVHIYEYSDQVPALMRAADGVICKAGGLVVTEALASGRPMMLINIIPGQETGNARFVVQGSAGDMAQDPMTALEVLSHWMMDDAHLLKLRSEIAQRLGKPEAAYLVAVQVLKAAVQKPVRVTADTSLGKRLTAFFNESRVDLRRDARKVIPVHLRRSPKKNQRT